MKKVFYNLKHAAEIFYCKTIKRHMMGYPIGQSYFIWKEWLYELLCRKNSLNTIEVTD